MLWLILLLSLLRLCSLLVCRRSKPLRICARVVLISTRFADGVNALRDKGRAFLVITHYQRLLDHIKPDVVHIMAAGRIIKTGGPELALEVEQNGYADILAEVL